MLCKCSGKYIDIYFNLKITFLQQINVLKNVFINFFFFSIVNLIQC